MKLIDTTIGELYSAFTRQEIMQLGKYIQNNYSSATNVIYKLHQTMSQCAVSEELDTHDYGYIKLVVFGDKNLSQTKLTTYVNKLHRVLKEFVILSKIESKNLYTEVLWSEYLIEHNHKRNLIINQANFKIDIYNDPYPVQKEYYHKRENFFLTFIKSNRKSIDEICNNTIEMMTGFENYYNFQMMDNFKTLHGYSNWQKIKYDNNFEVRLNSLIESGLMSKNEFVKIQALMLSILIYNDENNFKNLLNIFTTKTEILSKELIETISTSLLNYTILNYSSKEEQSYSKLSYHILDTLYNCNQLFPTPTHAHTRLGGFILFELRHGNTDRAREILSKTIIKVSKIQRDSCEKLCLARIEFAEKNYEQARIYIDQGNTNDSLHYYPLFKCMLLKILIYLKDEVRFVMERENLYKFLHKNKSLGEKNVLSYLKFYKYVDYMNESKFKTLSPYMKDKLSKALEPGSEHFHDKEWMRERMEELIKNSLVG